MEHNIFQYIRRLLARITVVFSSREHVVRSTDRRVRSEASQDLERFVIKVRKVYSSSRESAVGRKNYALSDKRRGRFEKYYVEYL